MNLRQYQRDAIDSIYSWFDCGNNAPLIVTPTGSGKSVILAQFIREAIESFPDTKILVLTHVKELVEQDAKAIKRLWADAPVGVFSAGLKRREVRQITVASIQSFYNKEEFYGAFDLIIVDEAHLIPHKADGMYRKLLDASFERNEYVKLIGLTATPYRLDSGLLHEGDDALFDGISYEANVQSLVNDGFLSPIVSVHGDDVELSDIKITAGDYNIGALSERMSAIELVRSHANTIAKKLKDRHSIVVFCVTVEHAELIAAALNELDFSASHVSGDMPHSERDLRINLFKEKKLRVLVNCSILTTGFDAPHIDAVVMLRPTLSPGLFVQCVGRGLRISDGKTNCVLLDFGGNVRRHGFIDQVEPPKKGKRKGETEAPVKMCPKCDTYVGTALRVCACGHEFQIADREAEVHHHVGAVMSAQQKPQKLAVDFVRYVEHQTKAGPLCLRVEYHCGFRILSDYVLIEHNGFARDMAKQWWRLRTHLPLPLYVRDALAVANTLRKPLTIVVDFSKKYPSINNYEFQREGVPV
jgi:DNA repair protein RadD